MKPGMIRIGDLGNGQQKKTEPVDDNPNTVTAADIEWTLHEARVARAAKRPRHRA